MGDMTDQDVLRLLKRSRPRRLTTKTVTDSNEILTLVQKARIDGYCMLSEQTEEGVGVIALPIHDHLGAVPAGIVVSGPIQRWNSKTMLPHLKRMKAIVDGVSRQLGQQPNESSTPSGRLASR
jgi:IclR family KDG regulon transcriptional repressor